MVVLCLGSLYREELAIITALKKRFAHLDVLLTQTDGRQAALAEAMRMGADGFVSEDGVHRIGDPMAEAGVPRLVPAEAAMPPEAVRGDANTSATEAFAPLPLAEPPPLFDEPLAGEAVLTADELRALLADQPSAGSLSFPLSDERVP
jgi:hypothetical protein